ncbi:hypothetical protein [Kineococcus rhizosphaerae]|uniref:Uncharacterized protein n=1 Tax=Kineococcus rhizosphaerae TaxID=559628 RepID=A0A2T0R555_9ACTN|nr:hypothetical protein [Kineococcus rhizosphaerae]PRY15903.1 hypothetical protein CLV37_104113 [Kineococcus rhizosphaerae]
MFGPVVAVLPLSLFLLAGLAVGGVLLVRRVPSTDLTAPVVRARRRGTTVAVLAVALAVALFVLGTSLPQTSLRRTQLIAVVPLAAAALHAAVLLVGELSWPRPAQRVRSARLAVRSVRQDAPRGMLTLFTLACALTWAVCVAGTAMAADDGRSYELVQGPMTSAHGPFPGAFYAGPIALAAAAVVAVTWAVLLRVPQRPAVTGADAVTDGALRRAAAHRALRVSTAGLLGTSAAMLVLGGLAVHGVGGSWGEYVGGTLVEHEVSVPAWADGLAAAVACGGGLLALFALAVLLVPARGIRRLETVR